MAAKPKTNASDTTKKTKATVEAAPAKKAVKKVAKKATAKAPKASKAEAAEPARETPQARFEEPKSTSSNTPEVDLVTDALKAMENKFKTVVLPQVEEAIAKATPVVMENLANAQEKAEQLADQALSAGRDALDKAKTAAKDHPVAVGAVGAAIGALAVKAVSNLFKKP